MNSFFNRRICSLFIVLLLLLIATQAKSSDCFVLLPGIDGQFKIDGKAGWIEVVHFRLCNTIREAIYSKSRSGDFNGGQLSLTKRIDVTSDRIIELSKGYSIIPEVNMKLVLPGRLHGKGVDLILKHVVIVDVIPSGQISGQSMEKVILNFINGRYETVKTIM
jgi:type VI protein secretion system component Hcp